MRCLAVVLFIAFGSSPSFCQNSKEYRACNEKAKTPAEMNACAHEEAARVDAKLDTVYAKLLSKAESDPVALAKIKNAEKNWIAYRDAYISAMFPAAHKLTEYGSMYPMKADLLRAKLTHQQITALNALLRK
jgi:uncharacterized protein YecT (DUF1311 family)